MVPRHSHGRASLERNLDAWRQFFSLTGGSILYCLSALSIIYGIAEMLGPLFVRPGALSQAYPCLAALNVYELALLGVLAFIVVWRNVTDDAISLVVLIALFLIGSGLTLSIVSNSRPQSSLVIGYVCFALGIGKLLVLRQVLGLAFSFVSLAGLAAVLAWNFGSGPVLADIATNGAIEKYRWLVSWLVLLGGLTTVLLDAMARWPRADTACTCFLRRTPMCLIFTLILAIVGGVHQHVLGYEFDVRTTMGDYLPLVSVVFLLALQLSLSIRGRAGVLEAGLASLPLVACGVAIATGTIEARFALGVEALWYPSVLLALTGAPILWAGVRRNSSALMSVSAAYAIGAVLTVGFSPAQPCGLNWYVSGFVLASGLFIIGLLKLNVAFCLLGVFVATIGIAMTDDFGLFTWYFGLTRTGAIAGIAGFGTLVVALAFGQKTPPVLALLGAMGAVGSVLDFLPAGLGVADLTIVIGLLSLSAALWLRTRRWPPSAVLCIPVAQRLWLVLVRLAAWKYVLLSFVLLFSGAVLSSLKGSRRRQDGAAPGHV